MKENIPFMILIRVGEVTLFLCPFVTECIAIRNIVFLCILYHNNPVLLFIIIQFFGLTIKTSGTSCLKHYFSKYCYNCYMNIGNVVETATVLTTKIHIIQKKEKRKLKWHIHSSRAAPKVH